MNNDDDDYYSNNVIAWDSEADAKSDAIAEVSDE